jgi:Bacterial Ig-like domain
MNIPCISLPISHLYQFAAHGSRYLFAVAIALLASVSPAGAQTYFNLAAGNYLENFTNIASWTDLTSVGNAGSNSFSGVAVSAAGAIPEATSMSVATTSFTATGASSGVQRPPGNIHLLTTGASNNTTSVAVDLNLNFSGRTAGNLSFNAATVFNSTGDRQATLRVYYSTNSGTWTEVTGGNLPYVAINNVEGPQVISVALPATFDNQPQVKLRFYCHNGPLGTFGSRPKISIDDVAVTSTSSGVADTTPPMISSFLPTNGTTVVPVEANLIATFDEAVVAGAGNIVIRQVSDHSAVATIPVGDAQVSGFGTSVVTINPTTSLGNAIGYYLEISSGAIIDLAGNSFGGISGNSTWTFTTADVPDLTASPYAQTFATYTSSATLPSGWSAVGGLTYLGDYTGDWATTSDGGFKGNASVYGYQHTSLTLTASPALQQILTLRNSTGAVLTDLTVAYKGRSELTANTRIPTYIVSVNGTEISELSYSTADGDSAQRHASISGLSIAAGATFQIKWSSIYPTGSGSARQIGISNVAVSVGSSTFSPTVAGFTIPAAIITHSTATANARVISSGGPAVTARGFVYAPTSLNSTPEIGGTGVLIATAATSAVGAYTAGLSGLTAATAYTVRAYATNSVGTSYTTSMSLTTLAPPPTFVSSYTQEFDHYLGTNPIGWTTVSDATTPLQNYAGTWGTTSTTGGFLGGATTPGVLGYRHTGSSGSLTVTLRLVNGTAATLTALDVSYLGRAKVSATSPEGRSPKWTVSIIYEATTSVIPALAYSTSSGLDATVSASLSGLTIAPGAEFSLAWVSDHDASGTGFSKQIGIAQVAVSVPTTGGYSSWKSGNAGGQDALQDFDNDGVTNGIEYFFGSTGSSFTQNPQPDAAGKISFPHPAATPGASYKILTSSDLINWTDVTTSAAVEPGFVTYTLPSGSGKIFARLQVDVTP